MITRKEALEQWSKLFSSWQMHKSYTSLLTLLEIWNKDSSDSILEREFRNFSSCIEEEYFYLPEGFINPKEKHKRRCFDFLTAIIASLFDLPEKKWKQMFEQCTILNEQSGKATDSWSQLIETVTKAPPTSYKEAIYTAAIEYLSKVEGQFDKHIRICYIWSKFSKNEDTLIEDASRLKIKQIQHYFMINYGNECLFEGYNSHIRNAIAHSSFRFDENNEKMVFEDVPAKWKAEYTDPEIMKLSAKIMNVILLTEILYAVIAIYDILYIPDNLASKDT